VTRSRIYDCVVTHSRERPVAHRFSYRYFTFCLDLEEADRLADTSLLFAARVFRFLPGDFIFGRAGGSARELKAAVIDLARKKGVTVPLARVELVANLRTFGYAFNPAAFYFCYDDLDHAVCAIVEITNTFREKKSYFLEKLEGTQRKLFYVSPFVELESLFRFRLSPPGERLLLRIDSLGGTAVRAAVVGRARPLTALALVSRLCRFPVVTLGVMVAIHYQALRLYLKRVPFFKKSDRVDLQRKGIT
jgi:DUF1365 family protein